ARQSRSGDIKGASRWGQAASGPTFQRAEEGAGGKKEQISLGGGQERIDKQHAKGKLTARERLDYLFDDNTFIELDTFVKNRCRRFGMDKMDFTGGALGEMHARKIVKAMDNAVKVGAPLVGLNDSGGARIQEAVDALSGYGELFYRNAIYSGVIPQVSAIMGPCAGGAVYSPALTDFIFMVDGTSQMFITGPQVIKTVTGEQVSAEELGGAKSNNSISGNVHFLSTDDRACLDDIRRLLSFLPSNNLEKPPGNDHSDRDINEQIVELNTLIPEQPNRAYDIKDVIFPLIDHGDFMEYQPYFAQNIVAGYARIHGRVIGVVANQPQ
ncbi:unnamed protein product, partial [Cyprideis torosa]